MNYRIIPSIVIILCGMCASSYGSVQDSALLSRSQFEVLRLQQDMILRETQQIRELLRQQKQIKEDRAEREEYQELLGTIPSEELIGQDVEAIRLGESDMNKSLTELVFGSQEPGADVSYAVQPQEPVEENGTVKQLVVSGTPEQPMQTTSSAASQPAAPATQPVALSTQPTPATPTPPAQQTPPAPTQTASSIGSLLEELDDEEEVEK